MRLKFLLPIFCLLACDPRNTQDHIISTSCAAPAITGLLPDHVREASGMVISRQHPGTFWVHNDGGSPSLFAIDSTGRELGHVQVSNAEIFDWEDLAIADCGTSQCLYIADIGDNLRTREQATIYRIPEPNPTDSVSQAAQAFHFRYPDAPHDAEALFVLPGERVFLITKGRSEPVTIYRYPGRLRDDVVTLEPVQTLSPGIVQFPDMVTGAAATLDGRIIAVRTYAYIQLYTSAGDTLEPILNGPVNLTGLGEAQGEAVAIREDGIIFLASEHGLSRAPAPLSRLQCSI